MVNGMLYLFFFFFFFFATIATQQYKPSIILANFYMNVLSVVLLSDEVKY